MAESNNGWLTQLGQKEITLAKELGYDHPDTARVRQQFSQAYRMVQAIRRSYNLSPYHREVN